MPSDVVKDRTAQVPLDHIFQLFNESKVDEALQKLSYFVPESEYERFIRQIIDTPAYPPTLELVLASTECGALFKKWFFAHFSNPISPSLFGDSLCHILLMRLSTSLTFAYPFERALALQLGGYRAHIEYAPKVLVFLDRFIDSSGHGSQMDDVYGEDEEEMQFVVRGPQRKRKAAKGHPRSVPDATLAKAFAAFGLEYPPMDVEDAEESSFQVLKRQAEILQSYLRVLRVPAVEAHLRQQFAVKEASEETPSEHEADTKGPIAEDVAAIDTTPAAYPMVQPMKAALYFDSAEGFGDWHILISTRADRDLRDARKKNAKLFKIIIKKIKELSKGHFSDDNQKRLNGPNTEIPIFEAKMTGDTRLIYQIDCIPEYDAQFERQIIKIFGVYTHAQINKHLWDSVGYQLFLKKGKEYRQRCLFRNHPKTAGDNVFSPACFPAAEQAVEEQSNLPQLPSESLEEMHTLLVLEKFVPFSQALLNSIIANLDVAHVFNVSPQEKEIIEYPYSCYVLGRSGTGKTTTMLFKMLGIERAYALRKDSMPKPRQIFVTQSRVLAGKVEEYFSKLLDSLATAEKTKEELAVLIKEKQKRQEDQGLIDVDDDHNWRGDLPPRFSQLQDQHFPLFLTFDRFASMLEADIAHILVVEPTYKGTNNLLDTENEMEKLITYSKFLERHWPHFPQNLKKGLDPALVFSEFMGVIQGSEESLNHDQRFLDKNAYGNLSHRAQYTFATRRETVYAIFQAYQKQKKASGGFDAADRTHRILNTFQTVGILGQKIDYLYVDEAQDNLLIDALLLRSLVRNPDGLFWAGDTAQTISVGSSFRFNDLKAFLFRLEKRREDLAVDDDSLFKQEAPRTFHLAINYRSHGGIVQCAHSVIELLTEFWPYAIDVLSREKGVVDGSKPVFFSGWDSKTVRYEQFLFGESAKPIEFGAQQCILVRDQKARDELRSQVGDIGLIMTLYESKGLEFDDVLLYNFFADSSVELSQWRVVFNLLNNKGQDQETPAPQFDQMRHAGVCSELKFLYVAITRARKNLWLVDCSEKSEPMRVFWTERNEIQNCTPGTDVPRLAVSSLPEEWEKSGRTLFSNKRFLQAMHCFERAGLERETAVSHAYYLRERARSTPVTTSKQDISTRQKAFLAAAEAFLQCATSTTLKVENKAYLRNAGDCFEHAQKDFRAADAYFRAGEYNLAVKLYRKCAKFDEAVDIVKTNREAVDVEVADNIIDIARLFYFKGGELEKASQLFDSIDEELEYLEDFDLDVSRAALLENMGKYEEAADIHMSEGRTLDAIRVLLLDNGNDDSLRRGYHCIVQGLWEKASFGVKGLDRIDQVVQLLDLASSLHVSNIASIDTDELSMFEAIRTSNHKDLRDLGRGFVSKNLIVQAILCLNHYFSAIPNMYSMSPAEISEVLEDFSAYCDLLQQVINAPSPCNDSQIQKLFSIVPHQDGTYFLPTATYLNNMIIGSRTPLITFNDRGIVVSEWELSRRLKEFLANELKGQISDENTECKRAQSFNTCSMFIINKRCSRNDCPQRHIHTSNLTRDWYNLQVKIHLQQILIIQIWCNFVSDFERTKATRDWVSRVFEVFYPLWYSLGGVHAFDNAAIPEAGGAFKVLRRWCIELMYRKHRHESNLLTTAYQVVKLIYHFDEPNRFPLIRDAPLTNAFRTLSGYQRKNGATTESSVTELLYSFSGINMDTVTRGVYSMKHMLDTPLVLDANVLYQTIEFLCGSIILIRRKFEFHGITLPLSWLNNLLRMLNPSVLDTQSSSAIIPMINLFVACMRRLVNSLHSEEVQIVNLLVEKSNLLALHVTRNVYIARLCRALCLLGYNVKNDTVQREILSIIQLLNIPRNDRPPSHLYKDYAHAKQWGDLAWLVRRSIFECPLDEMILLVNESANSIIYSPPHIRRVAYKNIINIFLLLKVPLKTVLPLSTLSDLRPNAPIFVPKPNVPEVLVLSTEPTQNIDETEDDNVEIINTTTAVDVIAIESLQQDALLPSESQEKAASVIQLHYRVWLQRKAKTQKPDKLSIMRASCFEACLLESLAIEWPAMSYYRRLFLGPIPHVLVCLKSAYTWAMEMKDRNKKRLQFAFHHELDDVNKSLTDQTKLLKRIRGLQKALEPKAEVHRNRDIEQLKKYVLEVDNLLNTMGSATRELTADIAIGLKGIVATRKPPKPKPKPTLGQDDDDYDSYYAEDVDERDIDTSVSDASESVHRTVEEGIIMTSYSPDSNGRPDIMVKSLQWVPVTTDVDQSTTMPAARPNPPQGKQSGDGLMMQSLSWVSI